MPDTGIDEVSKKHSGSRGRLKNTFRTVPARRDPCAKHGFQSEPVALQP
jgi:hypothetical protein